MDVTAWCWQASPRFPGRPRGSDGSSLPLTAREFAEAQEAAQHGFCAHCAKPLNGSPWWVRLHTGTGPLDRSFCSEQCVDAWVAGHCDEPGEWVPDGEACPCGCGFRP